MNRKTLALTLILALLIPTLAATLLVHVVTANPFMPIGSWSDDPIPPSISVQSPSETLNYQSGNDVWLNFTVTVPMTWWYSTKSGYLYPDHYATTFGNVTQVHFSVDEKQESNANKTSELYYTNLRDLLTKPSELYFSNNLGQLSVGRHTVIISAEGSGYYGNLTHDAFSDNFQYDAQESDKTKLVQSSVQINFVVGGVTPSISILSPTNTTYAAIGNADHITVPLTYHTDKSLLWVGYSLDGESNITAPLNGTLIEIPLNSQRLTLYMNDTAGNWLTPQTVHYEIMPNMGPTSPPEPFPTLPVAAASGAVAVVVAGACLFIYFKKRNQKSGGKA